MKTSHIVAGAIAVAIAVLAALLLAQTISAPLRRIRSAAERMERGDLEASVEPGGDAEVRAVGHALNRLAETLEHEEEIRRASVADLAHELRRLAAAERPGLLLVIAHEGRIDVDSAPGQGSRFRVSFPLAQAAHLHENSRSASRELQTSARS